MDAELTSVLVYQSWYEAAGVLGEEKQVKAMMQIIRYGLYQEKPDNEDDPALKALMMSWIPLVDSNRKKRKGGAPKCNQNAKGHGAPIGNTNAKKTNNQNKQPYNVNANVNGNANANANNNSKGEEHLPSVDTPDSSGRSGDTTLGDAPHEVAWEDDWED